VQRGKDRTVIKNRTHALLMAKNGIKHEFSDLFGGEGRNFLMAIELPESQRIARDVLLRKFYLRLKKEKGTKIAVVATARKLLRVIHCMLSRKESYQYERKALTESKRKRLEKTMSYVKNEMEKTRSREKKRARK
jgi:hypothetical protein